MFGSLKRLTISPSPPPPHVPTSPGSSTHSPLGSAPSNNSFSFRSSSPTGALSPSNSFNSSQSFTQSSTQHAPSPFPLPPHTQDERDILSLSHFQHFTLYETSNTFYIIGANKPKDICRLLIIDRNSVFDLKLIEDSKWYRSQEEAYSSIQSIMLSSNATIERVETFVALLGFIRLPKLHMVYVTKREKCGQIGGRWIYSINEYTLKPVYIERVNDANDKNRNILARYRSCFQSIDLTKDFYFSYFYDLTHSLQYNMEHSRKERAMRKSPTNGSSLPKSPSVSSLPPTPPKNPHSYNEHFTWNLYLTYPLLSQLPHGSYWLVPVIHGFFHQQLVRYYSHELYITLIARRSRHYAGTRYIKRGMNMAGDVANEVESEQIIQDSRALSHAQAAYASVCILRGSIPLSWSQENVYSVKPSIVLNSKQPYAQTKAHFDSLFNRYGNCVDVLSLIKKDEKSQEYKLGIAYGQAIQLLRNQLMDEEYANSVSNKKEQKKHIEYQTYDFINLRNQKCNVLRDIRSMVTPMVEKIGIFTRIPSTRKHGPIKSAEELFGYSDDDRCSWSYQNGVIRVNCIDCLDRTNVAQFCVGKAALILQCKALNIGSVDSNGKNDIMTELLQILQHVYTLHGDRIAHQYAGSGAMHKEALYDDEGDDYIHRPISDMDENVQLAKDSAGSAPVVPSASNPSGKAAVVSSTNVVNTTNVVVKTKSGIASNALSFAKRYYSNNVTDVDKQYAINIFLGNYIPQLSGKTHIWDLDPNAQLQDFDNVLSGNPSLTNFFVIPYEDLLHRTYLPRDILRTLHTEMYDQMSITSFDAILNSSHSRPILVGSLVASPRSADTQLNSDESEIPVLECSDYDYSESELSASHSRQTSTCYVSFTPSDPAILHPEYKSKLQFFFDSYENYTLESLNPVWADFSFIPPSS